MNTTYKKLSQMGICVEHITEKILKEPDDAMDTLDSWKTMGLKDKNLDRIIHMYKILNILLKNNPRDRKKMDDLIQSFSKEFEYNLCKIASQCGFPTTYYQLSERIDKYRD